MSVSVSHIPIVFASAIFQALELPEDIVLEFDTVSYGDATHTLVPRDMFVEMLGGLLELEGEAERSLDEIRALIPEEPSDLMVDLEG